MDEIVKVEDNDVFVSPTPKNAADLAIMTRKYSMEAVQTLIDIMRNGKSEALRIKAIEILLDRSFGKPLQTMDVDSKKEIRVILDDTLRKFGE